MFSPEGECEDLEFENDVLGEEEKCVTLTRTECKEEMVEARNEVCGYEYEKRTENAFIKGLGVDYDKTKVWMSRAKDKLEDIDVSIRIRCCLVGGTWRQDQWFRAGLEDTAVCPRCGQAPE